MKKVKLIEDRVDWIKIDRISVRYGIDLPAVSRPLIFKINGHDEMHIGKFDYINDDGQFVFISGKHKFIAEEVEYLYLSKDIV